MIRALISRWLYNVEATKTWAEFGSEDLSIRWWTPDTTVPRTLKVGEFIGQGRSLQYCGLVHTTMGEFGSRTTTKEALEQCTRKVATDLHRQKRPGAWYLAAITASTIVWAAVISAFAVDVTMSPCGLVGSYGLLGGQVYLLYGGLSSVSWAIQFYWEPRSRLARRVCHLPNALAVLTLLMAVTLHAAVRFLS